MIITVVGNFGTAAIRARSIGKYLAVHKTLLNAKQRAAKAGDFYTITHVPTGYAVKYDLPRVEALHLAKALLKVDWNFKTPRGANSTNRRGQVRRIFRDHALEAERRKRKA